MDRYLDLLSEKFPSTEDVLFVKLSETKLSIYVTQKNF